MKDNIIRLGTFTVIKNHVLEPAYCKAGRWTKCDYKVFVMAENYCQLKCTNCHRLTQKQKRVSITASDLAEIAMIIQQAEKLKTLPRCMFVNTMGDFFTIPEVGKLYKKAASIGSRIQAFSYFPKTIDLSQVVEITQRYNSSICLSLHGTTDEERQAYFCNPHPISSVINMIAKIPKLSCVLAFQHLVQSREKEFADLLSKFGSVCFAAIPFIDYDLLKFEVINVDLSEMQVPSKIITPNEALMAYYFESLRKERDNLAN